MTRFLVLSIRFLDDRYHGLTDHGERAEWPPSPFRLFQALVAGNARNTVLPEAINGALRWLESLDPPIIIAPPAAEGVERLTYVINNYSHKDAKSRTPKTIRPMLLNGDRLVQYAWSFEETGADAMMHADTVISATRRIRCLGWGIDMAIGTGVILDAMPITTGSRKLYRPSLNGPTNGVDLRTPTVGSLLSLERNYADFIGRYETPEVTRMEAAALYAPVMYLPDTSRPFAAFQLLTPDADRKWGRDARRTIEIAGMLRHATSLAADAAQKPQDWIKTFVLGHGSGKNRQAVGEEGARRFSYVPLPTIRRPDMVGQVNRALIVEPPGGTGTDAAWARRLLSGQELIDKNTQLPVALLSVAPASDWVVRQYTAAPDGSAVWSTVTPVVLPGYDDPDHLRERLKDGKTSEAETRLPGRRQRGRRGRPGGAKTAEAKKRLYERLDNRIEELLRKAIIQAGFSSTLAARADLSWRLVGFRSGLDLATRYDSPDHLKGKPRYHVRIHWKDATGGSVNVRGPVVIGAGRYCGLGLFARGG